MVPFPDWYLLKLLAHLPEGEVTPIKQAEVLTLWACSPMTAKRHLARLQQAGHLTYQAGRGRGNTSTLTLLVSAQQTVARTVRELVARRQLGELARLSRLPFPSAWTFTAEVQALFGVTQSREGHDRLRTVMFRPLARLHPVFTTAALESHLLKQVYDGLVEYDPVKRRLGPHLAHHWEQKDGQEWIFHLRKEVEFHDGRELTSRDVVATLDALGREAPWFLPHLKKVTEGGPYSVHLHLDGPDVYLPHRLSDNIALIRPAHALSADPLVGSGPFRFSRLTEGVQLTAFNHYFRERPLIDEVEIYHVAHTDQAMTWVIPGEEGAADEATVHFIEGVNYLTWDARSEYAHDRNLRLAVRELLDMAAFVEETGQDTPWMPAHAFAERRSAGRGFPPRSVQRATRWIREATRPSRPLKLACVDRWDAMPLAHWLAQRLTASGLPTEVTVFHLSETGWHADADLYMLAEVSGPDDQQGFWLMLHDPDMNFHRWLPPALLDKLQERLNGFRWSSTFEERETLIREAEAAMLEDAWVTLTHHRQVRRVHHPLMRDVAPGAFGRIDFRRFWLGTPE